MLSKYWTISSKPQAEAHSEIFELKSENITGECVVQNQFLTINPNQKPMLSSSIQPGQHLEDDAVGVVITSNRADIVVGDVVVHRKGMRQFAEIDADDDMHV